ncbi:hypothetical protein NIES22_40560 [Calothrix brevissima NIES-22]|nr:hypothetical protein NIES22_40560 [Calothrix brevissima NIES-22]
MTASQDKSVSQALTNETQKVVADFNGLDTDAKLAWFYFVYEKMGDSITPAAPAAAEPNLAPILLNDYLELSDDEQLAIMRQIVNGEASDYSRAYGALKENNQLLVWYVWAEAMGDKVVDLSEDYDTTDKIDNLLSQLEGLDFEAQMSVLRTIASQMGYSDVKPVETQAQTGKTPSL